MRGFDREYEYLYGRALVEHRNVHRKCDLRLLRGITVLVGRHEESSLSILGVFWARRWEMSGALLTLVNSLGLFGCRSRLDDDGDGVDLVTQISSSHRHRRLAPVECSSVLIALSCQRSL